MAQSYGRGGWTALRAGVVLAVALTLGAAPAAAAAKDEAASLQPEQIRIVQRTLQGRGYHVAPSGRWDEQTRAALGAFQSDSNLKRTGKLDAPTASALGIEPSAVSPVAGQVQDGRGERADPSVNCEINDTVDCRPGA